MFAVGSADLQLINFTRATYVGTSSAENQDDPSSTPDLTQNLDSDGESHTVDIGLLLTKEYLHQLPRSQKFRLISHTPDDKYNYPATYMHGCN